MQGMTRLRRYLPISYDVARKRVAIAGGGTAALAKLALLTRTQARITLYSPTPRLDLAAAAAAAGVDRIAAWPDARRLGGTALLFVATEDAAEDERLSRLARSLGIAVNAVDRPHLTDFAMPSIVDRGTLTVAVASDGAAPVLAQRVRALIDALLPPGLANLGDLARAIRSTVLERLNGNAQRRQFWWRTLDGRAGAAALAGDIDKARLIALADLDAAMPAGKISFVAVPAMPDLLTLRAQRLLLCADVIAHDAGLPADLLAMARRDAERVPAGSGATDLLIRIARTGRHVVRLDTTVSSAEVAALQSAGIDHEIVPGVAVLPPPSSSLAA
jgi:uroporphyrin-III C-methyltransferase/precorrin-2 dehydrogenase/sirohydrochlorin ferrochelatase